METTNHTSREVFKKAAEISATIKGLKDARLVILIRAHHLVCLFGQYALKKFLSF